MVRKALLVCGILSSLLYVAILRWVVVPAVALLRMRTTAAPHEETELRESI